MREFISYFTEITFNNHVHKLHIIMISPQHYTKQYGFHKIDQMYSIFNHKNLFLPMYHCHRDYEPCNKIICWITY